MTTAPIRLDVEGAAPAPPSWMTRHSLRLKSFFLGLLGAIILLVGAELVVVAGVIPEVDVPRVTTVIGELAHQVGESDFWSTVWLTAKHAVVGLAIAILVGIPIGVSMGANRIFRAALQPTVEFVRVVPGLALVPLATAIWGPVDAAAVFLVAFACTWIIVVQTMHGIESLDPQLLVTAHAFRISGKERLTSIIVPGAMPYVVTGVKIAVAIALIVAVGSELIIGAPGIGTEIRMAQQATDLPTMWALVVAAGVVGLIGSLFTYLLERLTLRWQQAGGN